MRAKGTRHRSYKAAIAFLEKHPEKVSDAWLDPFIEQGGSLFVFASPDGTEQHNSVACLTQLKGTFDDVSELPGLPSGVGARLLKKLRADDRIPLSQDSITVESLPAFGEWQERFDEAYAGTESYRMV